MHPAPPSARIGPDACPGPGRARAGADVATAAAALVLVGAAAVVGWWLNRAGVPIYAGAAPLFATWDPHLGPGTPLALLCAAAVIGYGPRLAVRLRWSVLLLTGYVAAVGWILALALVDGWTNGLAHRLTSRAEYLPEVRRVTDLPATLRGFAGRIVDFQPDSWNTHVSGHPPGALLVFVGLDRLGLAGGSWAAVTCVLVGALTAVAVPVTLRALGDEAAARVAAPFVVLFPGAVWLGASADAVFAGVTAGGIALLAVGGRRGGPAGGVVVLAGGVLLGFGAFLSYGLVLMAPLALAAALVLRRVWPLAVAAAGAGMVVAGFAAAGFWWYDGYQRVVYRYYQGIARQRPYAYWVWADLAALALSVGPVAAPVLRRALARLGPAGRRAPERTASERRGGPPVARLRRLLVGPVALPLAGAAAIAAADLSGLSKAEVERIWLPFGVWLMAGAALLPPAHRRGWLAVQAATAIAVNHLVLTVW